MSLSLACENMIKQQLRTNAIHESTILDLYKTSTREIFVPKQFKELAYSDMQIPLEHGQTMMTPLEEAKIIQSAYLNPQDKVLEIGTGTGFLTSLIAQLCQHVVSIDIFEDFIINARMNLNKIGLKNIELRHFDAEKITELKQTFDVIICTAAITSIPQVFLACLNPNGKIFAPIGLQPQNAQWIYLENHKIVGHEFIFSSQLPLLIKSTQAAQFIF